MESLLGSSGVVSCPGLSNHCKFGLSNQQAGSYPPTTELKIVRFRPLPFWELVWHLITQINGGDIDAQITVFYPRRDKRRRFINFLVYTLVYMSIASNLMTLATLSNRSEYFCTNNLSPFSRKPFLRCNRMVKNGLIINCQLELNIFGYQQPHYMWTQEIVKYV